MLFSRLIHAGFTHDIEFKRRRTSDNELERRIAFMNMFSVGGRNEIIPFLDGLVAWCPPAARYLASVCTRSFLERLYLLVESVKEVIETRISICEWVVTHGIRDNETISEEREALMRELSNLDARSDLDSTRVHVDEESLHDWYNETQRANERRYKQTVLAEGAASIHGTFLDFYNSSREMPTPADDVEDLLADTQIGSEFILLNIVEATLNAFINDKTFGLDSYLSRRIRHGTLRGILATPIARIRSRLTSDIENEERAAERQRLQIVAKHFDEWIEFFSERLDYLRREVIQVYSDERPNGLIRATWRNAINVTHLDAMMTRTRSRVVESRGHYDIFSDVFLLCWDFLEPDLAHLRRHIYHEFNNELMSKLDEIYNDMQYHVRVIAVGYWNEVAAVLSGRAQEVCGWFIRPVFRRDAYDVKTLVESTISIIRELDEGYSFQERVNIPDNLLINRGTFDVLGDILFVLIGNAAKHGKRGGIVDIIAAVVGESDSLIRIDIGSEVKDKFALMEAEARIRQAAGVQDLAQILSAGVDEGFSGIRKLIGLLSRTKNTSTSCAVKFDDDRLFVIWHVVVPLTIAFARERT